MSARSSAPELSSASTSRAMSMKRLNCSGSSGRGGAGRGMGFKCGCLVSFQFDSRSPSGRCRSQIKREGITFGSRSSSEQRRIIFAPERKRGLRHAIDGIPSIYDHNAPDWAGKGAGTQWCHSVIAAPGADRNVLENTDFGARWAASDKINGMTRDRQVIDREKRTSIFDDEWRIERRTKRC